MAATQKNEAWFNMLRIISTITCAVRAGS